MSTVSPRGYSKTVYDFENLRRQLPSGVVDGGAALEDQLGDGNDGIAVLEEVFDDGRERFGGVERGVVEQDDAAGVDLGCYALRNLTCC